LWWSKCLGSPESLTVWLQVSLDGFQGGMRCRRLMLVLLLPGQVPVNAGDVAGVNVQRSQRATPGYVRYVTRFWQNSSKLLSASGCGPAWKTTDWERSVSSSVFVGVPL
jgi:hypothetical protein